MIIEMMILKLSAVSKVLFIIEFRNISTCMSTSSIYFFSSSIF